MQERLEYESRSYVRGINVQKPGLYTECAGRI